MLIKSMAINTIACAVIILCVFLTVATPPGSVKPAAELIGETALAVSFCATSAAGIASLAQRMGFRPDARAITPAPSPNLPEYFKNELQRQFPADLGVTQPPGKGI